MIQFNDLRISQDKKYLIVDVQIQELDYYENVYLDSIVINSQDSYLPTGPNTGQTGQTTKEKWNITIQLEPNTKHFRKYIDLESAGLPFSSVSNTLFFVWVTSTEGWSQDTPCGMSDRQILGVTYDKYPLYLQGMKLFKQMQNCDVNADIKDYILQSKAFETALKLGNYQDAILYWNQFFDKKEKSKQSNCGCHGILR